jgi:Rha family phage regulatory protein
MNQISTPAIDPARTPVVSARGGEVFADSRDVAAFFGKEHRNVLRDIEGLLKSEHTLSLRHFVVSSYVNEQNGQTYRSYDMTRDGFTLLAMGFTGAKALKFKLSYIEAFNAMEAELRNRQPVDPMVALNDPAMLRGLLLTYNEKVIALEAENAELAPKADGFDQIANAEGMFNLNAAAKILGQPPHQFNQLLNRKNWIFKRAGKWMAYSEKVKTGLLALKTNRYTKPDGTEHVSEKVFVTPLGLTKISTSLRLI